MGSLNSAVVWWFIQGFSQSFIHAFVIHSFSFVSRDVVVLEGGDRGAAGGP